MQTCQQHNGKQKPLTLPSPLGGEDKGEGDLQMNSTNTIKEGLIWEQ